jgi:hypothetical protein
MVNLEKQEQPPQKPRPDSISDRLQALSEEAEAIRQRHLSGKISSQEATKQLVDLKTRHMSFFDRLF